MRSRKIAPRRTTRQTVANEEIDAIHDLELKHQESIHQIDLIGKEEDTRRAKMQCLLLHDDNTSIKSKLAAAEETTKQLRDKCDQYENQLQEAQRKAQNQDTQSRLREKEIVNLKTELDAINSAMQDATSISQRYHAATAELTKLKPELEHLRAQMDDYQQLIATKLQLERSLNQAEVQLETERRAVQRVQEKANQRAEEELRDRINELENQVSADQRQGERNSEELRKATQRADDLVIELDKTKSNLQQVKFELKSAKDAIKSMEKVSNSDNTISLQTEVKEKSEALEETREQLKQAKSEIRKLKSSEEEIENLKSQLKEAQSHLKTTRAELKAQKSSTTFTQKTSLPTGKIETSKSAQSKIKKRVTEIAEQTTFLDSPELNRRPTKKRPLDLAEKSNFSITPFLNRTKELEEVIDEDGELEDSILHVSKNLGKEISKSTNKKTILEKHDGDEQVEEQEEAEEVNVKAPKPKQKRVKKTSVVTSTIGEPKKRGRHAKSALSELVSAEKSADNFFCEEGIVTTGSSKTFGLDDVMEEDEEDLLAGTPEVAAPKTRKGILKKPPGQNESGVAIDTASLDNLDKELDGKRKKRRLIGNVGKTLFDDEDGEEESVPAETRKIVSKGKLSGKGMVAKAKVGKAGGLNAFGKAFSPLKKEKRGGVQHSFLQ